MRLVLIQPQLQSASQEGGQPKIRANLSQCSLMPGSLAGFRTLGIRAILTRLESF